MRSVVLFSESWSVEKGRNGVCCSIFFCAGAVCAFSEQEKERLSNAVSVVRVMGFIGFRVVKIFLKVSFFSKSFK